MGRGRSVRRHGIAAMLHIAASPSPCQTDAGSPRSCRRAPAHSRWWRVPSPKREFSALPHGRQKVGQLCLAQAHRALASRRAKHRAAEQALVGKQLRHLTGHGPGRPVEGLEPMGKGELLSIGEMLPALHAMGKGLKVAHYIGSARAFHGQIHRPEAPIVGKMHGEMHGARSCVRGERADAHGCRVGSSRQALRQRLARRPARRNGGTAIVMTADGYLITNAHTVSGAESITVQLSDGMEYAAALSGMDESSDLAVLKIEPETALQPAEFGDSAGAAAGDTVYVFSHPFGAAFDNATMTDGSIAAVQSGVRIGAETLNVFQTDAAPDSGSAGGPLVNEAGQVIGICIDHVGSYVSYQTVPELGFAIPISEAKTILDDLIVNGYVSGRVSLGLTVSEIPETYRRFWGLPSGVVIESVTAGSNAYYAGLHAGDVICQLGDSAVTNLNDYRSILSACHVGEELRVYIYRDGRQYYTDVTLTGKGESPSEIATEQMQNETE